MPLDQRSQDRLSRINPALRKIVEHAAELSDVDFIVTEGVRSLERQKQLVKAGASQTLLSRHLTGHAVDLAAVVVGEVRWDWPLYRKLAVTMKKSASELGIPLEWGGDWKKFKDGPHFQLPWKEFPIQP